MTKEVIVFPDTEALLIAWLNTNYAAQAPYTTVKANMTMPSDPKPASFTRLYRIGGSNPSPVVERSTVLVESYAKTTVAANALARFTLATLMAVDEVQGVPFYDPQVFASIANLSDPTVPEYERYTFTFSVGARGTAL